MIHIEPLCLALIDALLVFESAQPNEVDPDVAVRAMENMSASLQALSDADQIELRGMFEGIAEREEDERFRQFAVSVPDMMGLRSYG